MEANPKVETDSDDSGEEDKDESILANDEKIRSAFVNSTQVESLVNRDGDILPYAYHNPVTDSKLIWMCGEDQDGKITSVFAFDNNGQREKQTSYVNDMAQARFMRDELAKAGWLKLDPPKIEFTMPGSGNKVLNRKQRRLLARKLKEESKKYPCPRTDK